MYALCVNCCEVLGGTFVWVDVLWYCR